MSLYNKHVCFSLQYSVFAYRARVVICVYRCQPMTTNAHAQMKENTHPYHVEKLTVG